MKPEAVKVRATRGRQARGAGAPQLGAAAANFLLAIIQQTFDSAPMLATRCAQASVKNLTFQYISNYPSTYTNYNEFLNLRLPLKNQLCLRIAIYEKTLTFE